MSTLYKSPEVSLGQIVYWYPDGDQYQQPMPAIVLAKGTDSINVGIFHERSYNLMIRDGCRHISDPRSKSNELREAGGWDHTEETKELNILKAKLSELLSELKPVEA